MATTHAKERGSAATTKHILKAQYSVISVVGASKQAQALTGKFVTKLNMIKS